MTQPEFAPDPIKVRLQQVAGLLDVQRPAEAIPLLHLLIASYPGESEPYCYLAYALDVLERYDEARQAAERAVALDPQCEWAHRLHSSILLSSGNTKLAREAAHTAVQLDPEQPHGWHGLANAELALRNLPAAQGAAEQARALAPKEAWTHALVGRIALSGRLLDAAEAHFRHALQLEPESLDALNGLAGTLHQKGRRLEAMELYYQGVRQYPGHKWLRQNLLTVIENYLDPPDLGGALLGCALVLFAPLVVMIQDYQRGQERSLRLASLSPEIRRFYEEERKRKHKL